MIEFTPTEVRFNHGLYKYTATLDVYRGRGWYLQRWRRGRHCPTTGVGFLYMNGWIVSPKDDDSYRPRVYFKTLEDIETYLESKLERQLDFLTLPRMMVAPTS